MFLRLCSEKLAFDMNDVLKTLFCFRDKVMIFAAILNVGLAAYMMHTSNPLLC